MRIPLLAACLLVMPVAAQEPTEHTLAELPSSRYFVLAARKPPAAPAKPALLVVLPGGDGSAEFLSFFKGGIMANAPDDCVGVLVTAVRWRDDQQIVWPTAESRVPEMKYTTEDYVRAVVAAVAKEHGTDPARCMVLAWSSSGPGVYPLLVAADGPFRGGYVAMSIWPGKRLGELTAVKGRRFLLDQSMEDTVTRFSHVRDAFAALDKAGAIVRLSTYNGGHGWKDNPMPRLHAGLKWLFGDEPAPPPVWPGDAGKREPAATGKNLLDNGGFEQGTGSWNVVANSGRLKVDVSKKEKKGGKQALHLSKTGGAPPDLVVQEIDKLPAGERITLRLQVKNGSARNAWIKLWLYDDDDKPVHTDVDAAQLNRPGDWQQIEKTWTIGKARRAVLQIVMVMDGELWVDDVELIAGK